MTDEEKRRKVIRVLTCAANHADEGMISLSVDEVREIVELLREPEPRVMTLEELQAIGMSWNRNTPPYLFVERRSPTEARWMSWGFMHDFVRLWGTMNAKNYGSKWRVWNLQPTPEQMRETPWKGDAE